MYRTYVQTQQFRRGLAEVEFQLFIQSLSNTWSAEFLHPE